MHVHLDELLPFVELKAIHAQGSGGQNVNKVATAIHLRFTIAESNLPFTTRQALLHSGDSRITSAGVLVIKCQTHRSQELNRKTALERLLAVVEKASHRPKRRLATKPSKAARKKRLDLKKQKSRTKALRGKVPT